MKSGAYLRLTLLIVFAAYTSNATFTSSASAETLAEVCLQKAAIHPTATRLGDQDGVFLPLQDATRVLFVLAECLPRYEAIIRAQDAILARQVEVAQTSSRAIGLYAELAARERERADYWQGRSSDIWLWTAGGVLGGALLMLVPLILAGGR